MSNYHILDTNRKLTKARVIFHIEIPDELNNDSTNYRTAVLEWQGGGTISSKVPNLDTEFASEYAAMQTGEIYEYEDTVTFSSADLTNVQKRNEIDDWYTDLSNNFVNDKVKKILKFWGMNRDVPA